MIKYIKGDCLDYPHERIIAHVCNNKGGFGKGFATALSRFYPEARNAFKEQAIEELNLGTVQFVEIENVIVANMICQNGYKTIKNPVPLDYNYLDICLQEVNRKAKNLNLPVHMPRIGTGLAGGNWDIIKNLVEKNARGIKVVVWTL